MAVGTSLATATLHSSFGSQGSNSSRSLVSPQSPSFHDNSWLSAAGPDLTFAGTDDSSGSCRLRTPAVTSGVTPSHSSDSFRKTKSMMVFDSLPRVPGSTQSTSGAELLPSGSSSSLRRLRAMTLSVSTSEKGYVYRRKRHAVYGGQFSLDPNTDEHSFSVTPSTPELGTDSSSASLEPSPCILAVGRKTTACNPPIKSPLSSSKRVLNFLDPVVPTASLLSVPVGQSTITHARHVAPLKIARTRSKQRQLQKLHKASPQENFGSAKVLYHPIITNLLQELDLAISEWRVASYL